MHELTIYRHFFTASDCYRKGYKQQSVGVQVHSTGANNPWLRRYVGPDDGRLGRNQYGNHSNQPGSDVCASAYIGKLADGTVAVYQSLPWDVRCWLSGRGPNGNANVLGFVGFEICEDGLDNEEYFRAAVMGASVLLTAHLCRLFGVMPTDVLREYGGRPLHHVEDHHDLHALGLASNHGDIRHWLRRYGLTMDDYRAAVEAAMDEGVNVTYAGGEETAPATQGTDHPTLRQGNRGAAVELLQGLLADLGYDLGTCGIDGHYGPATVREVKAFQRQHGLQVDGIAGRATWAALDAAWAAQEADVLTPEQEDIPEPEAATGATEDAAEDTPEDAAADTPYTVVIRGLSAGDATALLEQWGDLASVAETL